MARQPLYEKDKAYKRTVRDAREERDIRYGRLLDLKNRNRVEIRWDMNDRSRADGIFAIRIGDKEAYLDAEQFRKFLRWC